MRGNESQPVSRQIDEWPVLSIPMRGNEIVAVAPAAPSKALSIPMRGNELSAAEVRASALTVIDSP